MRKQPIAVVDSNLLLALILTGDCTSEDNKVAAHRILKETDKHGYRLVYPAIVVAECVSVLHRANVANNVPDAKAMLRAFFDKGNVAEFDARMAFLAGDLGIKHKLKGADASILATAVSLRADYLLTCDGGLVKASGESDVVICEPKDFPLEPVLPGL